MIIVVEYRLSDSAGYRTKNLKKAQDMKDIFNQIFEGWIEPKPTGDGAYLSALLLTSAGSI